MKEGNMENVLYVASRITNGKSSGQIGYVYRSVKITLSSL